MKCSQCGAEHDLLEPSFRRPDAVVAMAPDERAQNAKEGNDLCAIRSAEEDGGFVYRYFVRCVLKVRLLDAPADAETGDTAWGLWVEVAPEDCQSIYETWEVADQRDLPPIAAQVANQVPGYPETIGLPVSLRRVSASKRPELELPVDSIHPFALECRAGVCVHRVLDWLASMA